MGTVPQFVRSRKGIVFVFALAAVAILLAPPPVAAAEANAYSVTPIASNNPALAPLVDPHLLNAWGLDASATSPWWVSDNGADLSTLYTAAGTKPALEVTVLGEPTGLVFNGAATSFLVGATGARFIFSTMSGTIAGWNGGGTATVKVDMSEAGAVYTGLAIATTATGPQLYAADFANARVDVFDGAWAPVAAPGGFVDPDLPDGYAPFGIQTIGSRIFVAYAKVGEGGDEVAGQSLGVVDAFDADGHLLARVAQRGQLNAPWGLAMAPANFGRFGGHLLVGNFGDGEINAYEEMANGHFEYRGVLRAADGQPIAIDGLWALQFGHGSASNGPTDTLFFTAGPNDEADGLFGSIRAA